MEDFVSNYLQYMRQPAFWWGGVSILLIAFVLLWLAGRVMAAWNTVLQFFAPAREAERKKQEPSPFRRLTGCLLSLLFLLFILAGLAVLVLRAFQM